MPPKHLSDGELLKIHRRVNKSIKFRTLVKQEQSANLTSICQGVRKHDMINGNTKKRLDLPILMVPARLTS